MILTPERLAVNSRITLGMMPMNDGDQSHRPATAPGDAVRAAMDKLGWSQVDLAFVLGVTTATINQIVAGKRGVSHSMAKALGSALGIRPETLVRLQAEWELQQAEGPDPIVAARARVLSQYPLRDMIKRGWIPDTGDPAVLETQVCRFFGVRYIDEVPYLAHAAKRSNLEEIPPPQLAWLFRVRQIAAEVHVPAYSAAKLQHALERLAEAREEPEGVRHVPRLMQEAGVRFVVVEALPSSDIDGVCLWLDDRSPVVGMSLRFDRIDNFWFVLRHECAHVIHGDGKKVIAIDADLFRTIGQEINQQEQMANREAAEFCVPQDKMNSFYLRKNPLFAERDVLAFAKRMNIHPGLVVGQLQRRTNRYDLLRRHLVRIRDRLAMTMMMDGWGDIIPVG